MVQAALRRAALSQGTLGSIRLYRRAGRGVRAMLVDDVPVVGVKEAINMIGREIKQIRQQKGLSAISLAKKAGLPPTSISNIEREVSKNPSFYSICKIAEALDVPVAYFAEQYKEG